MKSAALISLVVLGACAPTIDDLRNEPVRWTLELNAPYDTLANCITARSTGPYTPSMQIYQREGYAQVILGGIDGGVAQEITIRRLSDDRSRVEFRRRKLIADLGGSEATTEENAERCAAGK